MCLGVLARCCLLAVPAIYALYSIARFSHRYIWVHYFCAEEPDLQWILRDTEMVSQARGR